MGRAALAVVLAIVGLSLLAGCGDSAAQLPEPEPTATPGPVTDPDYAEIGKLFDGDGDLANLGLTMLSLADRTVLTGAHYSIELAGVAVTDQLTRDQWDALALPPLPGMVRSREPLLAGAGREFLLAHLTVPEGGRPISPSQITVRVIVDDQPRVVNTWLAGPSSVLVVNVPAGADTVLKITSASKAKTVDLRTGQRGGDADHPAELLEGGSVRVEDRFRTAEIVPASEYDWVGVTVTADPLSYQDGPRFGAAAPGQMWLRVTVKMSLQRCETCPDTDGRFELDLTRGLSIRPVDTGTPLAVPADTTLKLKPSILPHFHSGQWQHVFEVPEDAVAYEVTFETYGTFTTTDGPRTLALERLAGQPNQGVFYLTPTR